jgi:hypothetical protein
MPAPADGASTCPVAVDGMDQTRTALPPFQRSRASSPEEAASKPRPDRFASLSSDSDDESIILPLEQPPVEGADSIQKQRREERRRAAFNASMAVGRMLDPKNSACWQRDQEERDNDILALSRALKHARARREGAIRRFREAARKEQSESKRASSEARILLRDATRHYWKMCHRLVEVIMQLQARIHRMGEEAEANEDDRPLIYLLAETPAPSPVLCGAGSKRKSPATPAAASPPSKVAKPSAAASPRTEP